MKSKNKIKKQKKQRRHKKIRMKISGTDKVPRLCVFRSNKHIYGQLINDETRKTLVEVSDLKKIKKAKDSKEEGARKGKIAMAFEVGKLLAKESLEKKIEKVVFDRGGYKYHGRVKALAEGAREGGLKF